MCGVEGVTLIIRELRVLGNVVAVRGVSKSRHRHGARELGAESRKRRVQMPHQLALHRGHRGAVFPVKRVKTRDL